MSEAEQIFPSNLGGKRYYVDFYLEDLHKYIEVFGMTSWKVYFTNMQKKISTYEEYKIDCIFLYDHNRKYWKNILEKELLC